MAKDREEITVESMYGFRSDQPLVKLTIEGHEMILPISKARLIGQFLLEAAEGSISDAYLIRWARESAVRDGLSPEEALRLAAGFVHDFRAFRELERRAGVEREEKDEQAWRDRQDDTI